VKRERSVNEGKADVILASSSSFTSFMRGCTLQSESGLHTLGGVNPKVVVILDEGLIRKWLTYLIRG
jgi:hypothetical protein